MTSIKNAHLDWNESGTPVSDHFDDVYFSNNNGLEESRYVFLTQNKLPERWITTDSRRFVIGETGFGTGLNFLAVWQWFETFLSENPNATLRELHFISFEKYPVTLDDLKKAHEFWPELAEYAKQLQEHYPIAVSGCHRLVLASGAITLDLWFGDIKDCMPSVPTPSHGLIDAWFLDGFAPSKNPDMWSQDLFNNMVKLAKKDCTVATFTAAGFVRRGLIEAGFNMKKGKGFGTKRDMILGHLEQKNPYSNYPNDLPFPTADLTNIAIIGGGIASTMLALAFVRRGIKVTIYCQDSSPAQGASGNRQGAVYPLLTPNLDPITRIFSTGFLFARQTYLNSAKTVSFSHDWCGVSQLKWDQKTKEKLERLTQGQFDSHLITPFSAEESEMVTGVKLGLDGVCYPLGGWISPQEYTQSVLKALHDKGDITLLTHHPVSDIQQNNDDNSWSVYTNNHTYQHSALIVASGHAFSQFERLKAIPLASVKGQVSYTPTTDTLEKLKTVLCYDGYFTPQHTQLNTHCIGASYDRSNLEIGFDEEVHHSMKEKLTRCIPHQKWADELDMSDNEARQSIRSVSRDHLPHASAVINYDALYEATQKEDQREKVMPTLDNLYCLLGLGSRGLTSAPLLAEHLASQLCGDPLPFDSNAIEHLHSGRMWARKIRKCKPLI
ncbi:bifunctional tRNA (5-methylaminomethyl-2-thiouridine)(34)-methyltransferase MnmD/FAD-dependent 5-carboxymethylaminomethyl-2-thiouridine(34) oxidoreductase MnmC [Vibrio sp.]|nr:bifunctional tRNA (5-methylaminomethyl-2-thiouridine)(34)-methyltransferase MnmD/FAD-dependent 5-carboxymethylaminomethyl-2-thiouridine(34) oxidoreductase MnmC [Vibrio sp.]